MQMKTSIVVLACACALVAACVTEDNYPQRATEVACAKIEECAPESYTAECEATYEELVSATIEECDKYRGGLAQRCLNAVEEQACDEVATPEVCEKFNEKCGFDDVQPVGELDLESYGLGQLRPVEPTDE